MIRQFNKLFIVPKHIVQQHRFASVLVCASLGANNSTNRAQNVVTVGRKFNASALLFPLLILLAVDDDRKSKSKSKPKPITIDERLGHFIKSQTSIVLKSKYKILKQIAYLENISKIDIILIDAFLRSLPSHEVRDYICSDDHIYPIITACCNIELLKVLLKYQPNVEVRSQISGNTPLLSACNQFDLKKIDLLLDYASANVRSQWKYAPSTPLMYFCDNSSKWNNYDREEINRLLLKLMDHTCNEILLEKTSDGKTALDFIDDANKLALPSAIYLALKYGRTEPKYGASGMTDDRKCVPVTESSTTKE